MKGCWKVTWPTHVTYFLWFQGHQVVPSAISYALYFQHNRCLFEIVWSRKKPTIKQNTSSTFCSATSQIGIWLNIISFISSQKDCGLDPVNWSTLSLNGTENGQVWEQPHEALVLATLQNHHRNNTDSINTKLKTWSNGPEKKLQMSVTYQHLNQVMSYVEPVWCHHLANKGTSK